MAGRTFRFFPGQPLFPFGHGLSYTKFTYGPVQLGSQEIRADGTIRISTEVANIGGRDGDEVLQVYARRLGASDPHLPQQRLIAFERVTVPQSGHLTATLTAPAATLRRWDTQTKKYVVNAGVYELRIGASSSDIRQTAAISVVP